MKRLLAALFCLLIPSSSAMADGPGPQRKMTDKEASVFSSVRSTIQDALPKAPQDYVFTLNYQSDFDAGMVPEAIKPNEMFQMAYMARYTRDEKVREEEQTAYFVDRTKGTPEQQARMAELNAKDAELSQARKNAKDPAEKDKIKAERKALSAEIDKLLEEIVAGYQAWLTSGGTTTGAKDIKDALPAKELSIWVRINQDVSLTDKALPDCDRWGLPGIRAEPTSARAMTATASPSSSDPSRRSRRSAAIRSTSFQKLTWACQPKCAAWRSPSPGPRTNPSSCVSSCAGPTWRV